MVYGDRVVSTGSSSVALLVGDFLIGGRAASNYNLRAVSSLDAAPLVAGGVAVTSHHYTDSTHHESQLHWVPPFSAFSLTQVNEPATHRRSPAEVSTPRCVGSRTVPFRLQIEHSRQTR